MVTTYDFQTQTEQVISLRKNEKPCQPEDSSLPPYKTNVQHFEKNYNKGLEHALQETSIFPEHALQVEATVGEVTRNESICHYNVLLDNASKEFKPLECILWVTS